MEERTHGGDVYGLERPVLDLSISLNPMGVPPCAIQAAREALERPRLSRSPLPGPEAGHLRPGRRPGGLGAVRERGL